MRFGLCWGNIKRANRKGRARRAVAKATDVGKLVIPMLPRRICELVGERVFYSLGNRRAIVSRHQDLQPIRHLERTTTISY